MRNGPANAAPKMPEGMLAVGLVRGTHGLDGRLKVESLSGETEHFRAMAEITVAHRGAASSRRVVSVSGSGGAVILKLEGVDDVETARRFVGAELWAPRESAAPLGEEEYYYHDLCQCKVVFEGSQVGTVDAVSSAGGSDLLEVSCIDGRRVLVPFRKEFVGKVDVAEGVVELATGWILE